MLKHWKSLLTYVGTCITLCRTWGIEMITERLPAEIKQRLEVFAKLKNKSKSEIVKEALILFMLKEESQKDSYELRKEYFGKYGSRDGTISKTYKKKIKERLDAIHQNHPAL